MNGARPAEIGEVVTYHLEMLDPDQLRPAGGGEDDALEVRRAELPSPSLARWLYQAVGGPWCWLDRLAWSDDQWQQRLERPGVELWVGYRHGTPVGWFELEEQPEGNVEIVYFGLLPEFVGQGLGGRLLTETVRRAWRPGARRVWVHTCTLDHPAALANYQARGFRLFHTETRPLREDQRRCLAS